MIGLSFVICIEKLCEPNLVLSKICYQQKYNVAVRLKLDITNFKAIHHRDKLADYLSHKMLVYATPHTFDECSTAVKKYSSGSFKWLKLISFGLRAMKCIALSLLYIISTECHLSCRKWEVLIATCRRSNERRKKNTH